jgi:hypothetical protein
MICEKTLMHHTGDPMNCSISGLRMHDLVRMTLQQNRHHYEFRFLKYAKLPQMLQSNHFRACYVQLKRHAIFQSIVTGSGSMGSTAY